MMHTSSPLNKLTNWQSRQRDSINFWMGVEAGRKAARVYKEYQERGSRRAHEFAAQVIESLPDPKIRQEARKEFALALSLMLDEDNASSIVA
jgi:hypothetical protein